MLEYGRFNIGLFNIPYVIPSRIIILFRHFILLHDTKSEHFVFHAFLSCKKSRSILILRSSRTKKSTYKLIKVNPGISIFLSTFIHMCSESNLPNKCFHLLKLFITKEVYDMYLIKTSHRYSMLIVYAINLKNML